MFPWCFKILLRCLHLRSVVFDAPCAKQIVFGAIQGRLNLVQFHLKRHIIKCASFLVYVIFIEYSPKNMHWDTRGGIYYIWRPWSHPTSTHIVGLRGGNRKKGQWEQDRLETELSPSYSRLKFKHNTFQAPPSLSATQDQMQCTPVSQLEKGFPQWTVGAQALYLVFFWHLRWIDVSLAKTEVRFCMHILKYTCKSPLLWFSSLKFYTLRFFVFFFF